MLIPQFLQVLLGYTAERSGMALSAGGLVLMLMMPVAGRIAKISYRPGLFVNADLDKASDDNERNALAIETPRGKFAVVQIAGLIARRIVCFSKQGDTLGAGERFGLIRFGSRVDVYCPTGVTPLVAIGSKAIAGETILADYIGVAIPRSFRTS